MLVYYYIYNTKVYVFNRSQTYIYVLTYRIYLTVFCPAHI